MNAEVILPLMLAHLAVLTAGAGYLTSGQFARQSPNKKAVIGLALAAALAVFAFIISEPTDLFSDFRQAYYPAGKAVLESPSALAPFIDASNPVDRFVNLPIVAYLFAPFGAFSLLFSRGPSAIFLVLGIGATLWAWVVLARAANLAGDQKWLLLLLIAANGPLVNSLREGNTSHMILLGLAGGLVLLNRRQDVGAGVILGVCALIKLPLLIFGAYFVLRRNWNAVFGFSGTLMVAGLMSLWVFGWELNRLWFELCVLQFSQNALGAFNVQSIVAFALRLDGGTDMLRDWSLIDVSPSLRMFGRGVALALLAAAIAVCARRPAFVSVSKQLDWRNLEYSLVIVLAILASPLSWTHYYCWLLVPVAFFLSQASALASTPVAQRLGWAAIILISPVVTILSFPGYPMMQALYAKLLVSHYLLGALIWFGLLIWALAAKSAERTSLSTQEANTAALR